MGKRKVSDSFKRAIAKAGETGADGTTDAFWNRYGVAVLRELRDDELLETAAFREQNAARYKALTERSRSDAERTSYARLYRSFAKDLRLAELEIERRTA